jgi:hypothetical protein
MFTVDMKISLGYESSYVSCILAGWGNEVEMVRQRKTHERKKKDVETQG